MKRETKFYESNVAMHTYTTNSKSEVTVDEMKLYKLIALKETVDMLKMEVDTLAQYMLSGLQGESASEEQFEMCETPAYRWALLAMDILDMLPDCD